MDEGERYQEHEPPASLRPFVRTIWTYAAPAPEPTVQRIAPDGCPELILDIGSPYEEQGPDGVFRLQPQALFAGQMTRPLALRPVGPVELVAVRFEPDGARDWLGHAAAEATDRRLDMTGRLAGVAAPGVSCATCAMRMPGGSSMSPDCGCNSPASAASSDDFPQPFAPTTPMCSPAWIAAVTSLTKVFAPRASVTARIVIIACQRVAAIADARE